MSARRLWVVVFILVVAGMTVVARAVQVTVVDGELWRDRATRQHEQSIEVPGPRGTIRTADGYVLATSLERVAIQTNTFLLDDPELFARAAAPLLGLDGDDLSSDSSTDHGRCGWPSRFSRRPARPSANSLRPRWCWCPDFARIYPLGSLAAPVVGFVGREELRMVGRAGLEHYYDLILAGDPQSFLAVNDAIQRKVRLERLERGQRRVRSRTYPARADPGGLRGRAPACAGRVRSRRRLCGRARSPDRRPARPRFGPVVRSLGPVVRPLGPRPAPTGAVAPATDPGRSGTGFDCQARAGGGGPLCDAVRPGERFDCSGRGIRLAGFWIRDHVDPGRYTIDEVVAYSANAGIIEIAERIPQEHLYRTFSAFGFGRRSKIGFPGRGAWPHARGRDLVQAQPCRFRARPGAHGDSSPGGPGLCRHRQRRLAAVAVPVDPSRQRGGLDADQRVVPGARPR